MGFKASRTLEAGDRPLPNSAPLPMRILTLASADARIRLPALDGVRGLAALVVVLDHASEFGFASGINPAMGAYGVLLFYSLSGFLMSYLYGTATPSLHKISSYAAARIVRITPVYYVVVVVSWLIYEFSDHNFVYNISTTQLVRSLSFNGSVSVFWSIGPEFQFYAVFVLLWWLWHRPFGRCGSFGLAGVLCVITWATAGHISGVLFLSKSPIFLGGIAASIAYDRMVQRRVSVRVIAIMQAISFAFLILLAQPIVPLGRVLNPPFDRLTDPTYAAFYCNPLLSLVAAFVVLSFAFSTRMSRLLFANPFTRFLGEISFSLYLLHDAVLYTFARWAMATTHATSPDWLASLAAVLVSVGVASISYRLIEVISRDRLRQPVTCILENWGNWLLSRLR